MEAKRLKNEVSQKLKEEQHKLRKLSKMRKTAWKTVTSDYFLIVDNVLEGMLRLIRVVSAPSECPKICLWNSRRTAQNRPSRQTVRGPPILDHNKTTALTLPSVLGITSVTMAVGHETRLMLGSFSRTISPTRVFSISFTSLSFSIRITSSSTYIGPK
ncbi:hypothetical protein OUZ56_012856 [Daphnia magna]|uniref:Uncharacterized protein n=1 Tax=Daphnia magna TaxID=35525 RepID=A0ABQ9Z491_9CRUS|nr:hypothetical protein OUZ56_012856 [Daphnia magna]